MEKKGAAIISENISRARFKGKFLPGEINFVYYIFAGRFYYYRYIALFLRCSFQDANFL